MAQALSGLPFTAEAVVRFPASSYGIWFGQNRAWSGFPSFNTVLLMFHTHHFNMSLTRRTSGLKPETFRPSKYFLVIGEH
jgi:hypothetical protein